MTHPLTDEAIKQIADTEDRPFTSIERENMRAAYDLAIEHVTEWLQSNLGMYEGDDLGYTYITEDFLSDKVIDEDKLITDLKKAMHQQEES